VKELKLHSLKDKTDMIVLCSQQTEKLRNKIGKTHLEHKVSIPKEVNPGKRYLGDSGQCPITECLRISYTSMTKTLLQASPALIKCDGPHCLSSYL